MGRSNIANQNLKKQVLTQNLILSRIRLFSASESQYNISKRKIAILYNISKRKIIVYNVPKIQYFGMGSSNIANRNLKKRVLTQNFILSRMRLLPASESHYNISKRKIIVYSISKRKITVYCTGQQILRIFSLTK